MKATLKFKLPEEEAEHQYALAGCDALLLIDDILNEIRSSLKYDGGQLNTCEGNEGEQVQCCPYTLQKVREYICEQKHYRKLPELI